MVEPFEFSEIDEQDRIFTQYPNLKINNSPAFYLILRGIIGNIQIKQTFREITFQQTRDFLNPVEKPVSIAGEESKSETSIEEGLKTAISNLLEVLKTKCKSNLEILPKYISDTFSLKDLSDVLSDRRAVHRNKNFFESLNNEFSNFYYHTSKENHTVAFLHLYRILEFVSYSFPVMYAASTKDFSKSFDILKTLFSGDKDKGELKVFKDFIENVMSVEKDYKRLSIDINIISDLEEYNERVYNTILSICDKSIFEEPRNKKNSKISIKFPEFSSFIITIRNRFFHLKNSQDNNIQSVDIVDSDFFFSLINRKCAYFLSLVTLVVIKRSYFQK
ncbi:hypothetical protein [Mongoliibacter ruber]|uniref:Uncharacterized protein n=1 Tax=Mongoliibacter ruber TaxID=1750599 RepID=A0A2T0WS54_9BACT|nr:hypothetical protein [Mongoliibacter ruber]PRY89526.1 hypothetical protein CLW00_1021 [Mongoliibacter ruber]